MQRHHDLIKAHAVIRHSATMQLCEVSDNTTVTATVRESLIKDQVQILVRIYHESKGGIEKSVPRIMVWHREACRVMTNDDPEGWIFYSYGLFFLLTMKCRIFLLKNGFQRFVRHDIITSL